MSGANYRRQRGGFTTPTARPILKWWTYSQSKRDEIIDQFWREYFEKYPEKGSIPELNDMRDRLYLPQQNASTGILVRSSRGLRCS